MLKHSKIETPRSNKRKNIIFIFSLIKKNVFNQNIAVCFKIKTDRYILLSNMLIYYILEAIINAL